ALVWMASPTLHKISNESGVNTENSDFSAFPINGKIHYAGEPELSLDSRSYGWTGNSYLRIYTADGGAGQELNNPLISQEQYNDKNYHVDPVSSKATGNTLAITRT